MADAVWYREAEQLVGEVGRITAQRDALLEALKGSEPARLEAEARVDELVGLNSALQQALWRGEQHSKTRVGVIATAIAMGAASLGAVSGGAHAGGLIGRLSERAAAVAAECDVTLGSDHTP